MKKILAFMLLALVCETAFAQITQKDKDDFFGTESKDDFFGKGTKEDFFSKDDPGFAAERQKMYENYNKFRKEALENYSNYVRKAWKDYNANPAIDAPKDEMIKPQIAPGSEEKTASWFTKFFGIDKKKIPTLMNRRNSCLLLCLLMRRQRYAKYLNHANFKAKTFTC